MENKADVLGLHVVRAILEEKSFDFLREKKFDRSTVFGEALDAYDAVLAELGQNRWPTPAYIESITAVKFPEPKYTPREAAELLRKRALNRTLAKQLKDALVYIDKRDPDKALECLRQTVINIEDSEDVRPISYRATGPQRYERYQELKSHGGFQGYYTPWPSINEAIQGWVNDTLSLLVGYAGQGKSWSCCYIANDLMAQGANVLFVTMEMSAPAIGRRIDSVRYKIPFPMMRDGSIKDEDSWRQALLDDLDADTGNIYIAEERVCKTVPDILVHCQTIKPTVVIIDGGYRLTAPGKTSWESTSAAIRQLQRAAKSTGIPWIVSTQMGAAGSKKTTKDVVLSQDDIRYAREWSQDADVILGLHQTDSQRINGIMQLQKLKIREGSGDPGGKVLINWDQSAMDFSELSQSGGFDLPSLLDFTT